MDNTQYLVNTHLKHRTNRELDFNNKINLIYRLCQSIRFMIHYKNKYPTVISSISLFMKQDRILTPRFSLNANVLARIRILGTNI